MPFLITTKTPVDAVDCGHPDAPSNGWPVSRRAVATLNAAQASILDGPAWDEGISTATYIAIREQAMALTESSGGSIRLPNGNVIEVEMSTWEWLAADAGLVGTVLGHMAACGNTEAQEKILASYNAPERAHA